MIRSIIYMLTNIYAYEYKIQKMYLGYTKFQPFDTGEVKN